MNKVTGLRLWIISIIIIGSVLVFSPQIVYADVLGGFIPPTPAFKIINTTSGNVTATDYKDFFTFIAGTGIIITVDHNGHTFTFDNSASGGNVIGEGVQGRLAIWNDTAMINSTALLKWDFNTNILNIANGHFFNSTHYNIGTSRILGSMTCTNGAIIEYQSSNNTWVCGIDDNTGGSITTMESLTNVTDIGCATGQVLKVSGTTWECANDLDTSNSGNSTVLTDLGDVIISGASYGNILINNGTEFINRLFMINTQSATNDFQVVGINNQTGAITTNQFSVNTVTSPAVDFQVWNIDNATGEVRTNQFSVNSLTCGGTDKISSINNATGEVICSTVSAGSGNSTVLTDLGDVIISGASYGNILINNGTEFINRLFMINTQSATNDFQVVGINNQTGAITTNQFSVNTVTSPAVDFQVWNIDNATGEVRTNQFSVNTVTSPAVDFQVWNMDNATGEVRTNQFSVNTVTSPAVDFQVYDLNNATGEIKTNQFSVNTLACSGTDKIKSVNNVTGEVLCGTDQTGSGGSGIPKPTQASPKKWGELIPVTSAASFMGLAQGLTPQGSGTALYTYNATDNTGQLNRVMNASPSGDNAGFVLNLTSQNIFQRQNNPYVIVRQFQGNTVTDRIFIGFHGIQQMKPNGTDTIVDTAFAFGICIRTTDTIYQRCENDSAGAGTYTSMAVTEDGNMHTFEVYADATNNQWCAKIDGGAASCATTDIPLATTQLYFSDTVESSNNQVKTLGIEYLYIENDK